MWTACKYCLLASYDADANGQTKNIQIQFVANLIRSSDLKHHIKTLHTGEKSHMCTFCNKSFTKSCRPASRTMWSVHLTEDMEQSAKDRKQGCDRSNQDTVKEVCPNEGYLRGQWGGNCKRRPRPVPPSGPGECDRGKPPWGLTTTVQCSSANQGGRTERSRREEKTESVRHS